MDDAEWSNCTQPAAMLVSLQGKLSDRKLRLISCACLRRVWLLLPDDSFRQVIAETEWTAGHTEGTPEDALPWWRRLIIDPAFSIVLGEEDVYDGVISILGCAADIHADGQVASWRAAHSEADPVWRSHVATLRRASASEQEASAQACVLRDVVGIPSRCISLEPMLLQWNEGIVVRLAQSAYDERLLPEGTLDVSRLAILADALEEAGSTDAGLLGHLRGPGPHVRGCYAIDAILGKS